MQILASILDEETHTFKKSHKVHSYSISDIAIIIYAFGASELAKNKSNAINIWEFIPFVGGGDLHPKCIFDFL